MPFSFLPPTFSKAFISPGMARPFLLGFGVLGLGFDLTHLYTDSPGEAILLRMFRRDPVRHS